ncbi:unnamed protein product, partial [Prorocentrum cordatum]
VTFNFDAESFEDWEDLEEQAQEELRKLCTEGKTIMEEARANFEANCRTQQQRVKEFREAQKKRRRVQEDPASPAPGPPPRQEAHAASEATTATDAQAPESAAEAAAKARADKEAAEQERSAKQIGEAASMACRTAKAVAAAKAKVATAAAGGGLLGASLSDSVPQSFHLPDYTSAWASRYVDMEQRRRRQRTEGKQAPILFANIAEHGPQAAKFLAERGKRKYKAIACVETHATAAQLTATRVALGKDGWRVAGTPATPSGKAKSGTSGGEMWCLDKTLAATTYERHRRRHLLATVKEIFVGFCPVVLHLKEGNVVLVAMYLQPGLKSGGINRTRLLQSRTTCDKGQGRMYDYAVAKQGWHHRLRLQAIFDVPWKTHCAIEVIIEGSDRRWHHDELVVARSPPVRERPPKEPDPESKSSRRKAEALQSRARALPQQLQETPLEIREQGEDQHPEDAKPFFITEDVWPSCRPALGDPIPRAGQMEYFINASRPDDVQEVSLAHGNWTSQLEEAHIAVERPLPDQARARRGRAHGHSIRRVKANTTPGRAHSVDAGVELWSTPTALAIRARALVANNTDSDQLDYALGDFEQRCDTIADEGHRAKYVGNALSVELDEWRHAKDALLESIGDDFELMSSSDLIGALEPFIEVSERWACRALGRSHAKARRGFIEWAKESWKPKAGVIYRHVREPQAQQTEVLLRGTAAADPSYRIWVTSVRELLRAHMEPITLERLDVVLTRASSKKAKGIDNITAQLFVAPTHLRQQRWLGPRLAPQRSVVAGSSHGNKCAKLFLAPILRAAHLEWGHAQLWTFVDDTVARAEGKLEHVRSTILGVAESLKAGLDEQHLQVPGKTVGIASHPQLAKDLHRALARRGVPCAATNHAVGLGVDTAAGRVRTQRRALTRRKAGQCQFRRIFRTRRHAQLSRVTKALWPTAALPRSTYGHQAFGLAPSAIPRLRRGAALSAAGKGPGWRPTSIFATLHGDKEPGLELRRQLLGEWLDLWRRAPQLRSRIGCAWRSVLAKLVSAGPKRRWRAVRGPMAALMAMLLDAGWSPTTARSWTTASGVERRLPGHEDLDMDTSAVQDGFVVDLTRAMWSVASKHLHGDDLCEGADATLIAREQQHYLSRGQMDMYAQNIVVISGGQWPRVRQREAGYELESVTCRRCGHEDETLHRRIWSCLANRGRKEHDSTNHHLAGQASVQHESQPSLWLRGLPALHPTTPLCDEDLAEWPFEVGDFR